MIEIIIILIILIGIYLVTLFNKFKVNTNKVEQAESNIDIFLKKRFDLIPNLVNVTKKYMEYESDILIKLVELRNEYKKENHTIENQEETNNKFNNMICLLEDYPEIKASEEFLKLQEEIINSEEELQSVRRIYNMEVTRYNILIEKFPNNILSKIFSIQKRKLFAINYDEKNNIKVK